MTKTNIAQMFEKINTSNATLDNMSKNHGGSLSKGKESDRFVAAVLQGSSDKAADMLRGFGMASIIPIVNYVTLSDAAEFYGVNEKHIKNVLIRNRFGPTTTGGLIVRRTLAELFSGFGLENVIRTEHAMVNGKSTTRVFIDPAIEVPDTDNVKTKITFNRDKFGRDWFLETRVVLALGVMMYFARYIPRDSMVAKVYEGVKHGSYAADVLAMNLRNKYEVFEPVEERMTFNKQELADFVMKAIDGMVFGDPKPEPGPANLPKRSNHSKRKISKPANWDEVTEDYRAKRCTKKEAAERLNISLSTFYNYYSERKSFVND